VWLLAERKYLCIKLRELLAIFRSLVRSLEVKPLQLLLAVMLIDTATVRLQTK
jgi:hypothetical protein